MSLILAVLLATAQEEDPRRMLYRYLEGECAKKLAERKRAVEALKTPEDVARRQADLRAKFLSALGGFPERTPLRPQVTGTLRGEGFRVEKIIFESRPDHHVTANLYLPDGHEVIAVDLRGMGETEPLPPHRGLVNFVKADWKEAYLAFNLNRPLLGQRVRDLLSVAAAIDEDGRGLHLIGVGAAAPPALHAAALDPRFRQVTLDGMVLSWSLVARTPITIHQLTNVVPGALEAYDLPDLAASLAPRPLAVRGSTDPEGKPLSQTAIDSAYAPVSAAYEAEGAEASLDLRAK